MKPKAEHNTRPPNERPDRARWGAFTLSDEDIASFKAALSQDVPNEGWTDDELREMAMVVVEYIVTVLDIAAEQNRREGI